MKKSAEIIIIALLYLFALYMWTLPLQSSDFPFGDVDSSVHFMWSDYSYMSDKPMKIMPYYMQSYWTFNEKGLLFPPQFHFDGTIVKVFGGERMLPFYILMGIFSSLIVLVSYFIVRNLFGFWPAFLASFMLTFSMRDILTYLWSQWPERIAFYFVLVVIYTHYKYISSYIDKKEDKRYLFLLAVLLGSQFMHPQGFMHSVAAIVMITLVFMVKEKKFFVFNPKYSIIAFVVVLVLVAPFAKGPVTYLKGLTFGKDDASPDTVVEKSESKLTRLFYWYKVPDKKPGVPEIYFSYKDIYQYWTIPFLIAGILFIFLRRDKRSAVMIGWLLSLYVLLHLDVIGTGRPHRSLAAEAHLFIPLMAIGAFYLPNLLSSFIKINKAVKNQLKVVMIILFLGLVLFFNAKPAYTSLEGAYPPIVRINSYQVDATEWLRNNVPEDADIIVEGTITYAKKKWLQSWSMRHFAISDPSEHTIDYIFVDYSDFFLMGNQQAIAQLQDWENKVRSNITTELVYDNVIKVYKIE